MVKFKRSNKSSHYLGFTVVELIVAVIIIGILVSIAIPAYFGARRQIAEGKAIANLKSIYNAQKAYWFDQPETAKTYYIGTLADGVLESYVDYSTADGDWTYAMVVDATTFAVTASGVRPDGTPTGREVYINQTSSITRNY